MSTGDGQTYALGQLCAPTAVTWREQRVADLIAHTYTGIGPYTATLSWGATQVQTQVQPQARELLQPTAVPEIALFGVVPVTGQPFQRLIKLRVEGLAPGHSLRLDGGAGQVHMLTNESGASQAVELSLDYAKPGSYTVTLDLLDSAGLLARHPGGNAPGDLASGGRQRGGACALAAVDHHRSGCNHGCSRSDTLVALPVCAPHTQHLHLHNTRRQHRAQVCEHELLPDRTRRDSGWQQAVVPDRVGRLDRGRCGHLNRAVRVPGGGAGHDTAAGRHAPRHCDGRCAQRARRAGVSVGNPPIATLRAGAEVTIYEERVVSGATWYRIGENRWVYGAYVRIVSETTPPPTTRRGIVTADVLNVRAAPGVSASNPPIATLRAGAEVTIYEEQSISGALWYRIGENRWVAGSWVRVLEANATTATRAVVSISSPTVLPLGWVVANALNVRAQPGIAASNPPIGQLGHYAPVAILEQTAVSGVRWFRIGENQWIEGRQVGVARAKTRPASIGASTRWVGVSLSEQTFVAYVGDQPIFAGLTASGLPGTPTVQGVFRTWRRLETGKMSGPGYYIEDVTWTCYFYSGYALHTAYWHDSFGTTRSHGCVNLSPHDAWWIYQWSAAGGANSPTVYVYWA